MPRYHHWPGVINAYREFLPVSDRTPVVTLREGGTPLIEATRFSEKFFGGRLKIWLKFEGLNPTGSFKDRGMTMAISKAKEEGSEAVICASTGNTSAAAAAYAAKAGMRCAVLIPEGKIARGKLAQALIHGAVVVAVKGNFDDALRIVRDIATTHPITLVNSVNPFRLEGQKTAAFEIVEALGEAPDFHALPVGNAGNITAYWAGYKEWNASGRCATLPTMLGFQAAGSAPIVLGYPVEKPETICTAIRIGNPASWKQAIAARDESHGTIGIVTDEEVIETYRDLASHDGIFAEPSSMASLTGVRKLFARGYFDETLEKRSRPAVLVCTLTGHGLKDPDTAIANTAQWVEVEPTTSAVLDVVMGTAKR